MSQYIINSLRRALVDTTSEENRGDSDIDYNEKGRDAMAALGIDGSEKDSQGNLSPIWRHPTGGGTIYVGNIYVAQNLSVIQQFNIRAVVNCTHGHGALPNFHENVVGGPKYYTFPVSQWWSHLDASHASVCRFTDPMFRFIEDAIAKGENVLVHCLAGAHRAGTTGVACLMHFAELEVATAIVTAKRLRPIIDPIGQLPEFLHRLQAARNSQAKKAAA